MIRIRALRKETRSTGAINTSKYTFLILVHTAVRCWLCTYEVYCVADDT